jgi:hypothetical protein
MKVEQAKRFEELEWEKRSLAEADGKSLPQQGCIN